MPDEPFDVCHCKMSDGHFFRILEFTVAAITVEEVVLSSDSADYAKKSQGSLSLCSLQSGARESTVRDVCQSACHIDRLCDMVFA